MVKPGERILLAGANGSGKTTLLRTLATALTPSQGSFKLFGMDPVEDQMAVRRRLALLTHSLGLYEDLNAVDNLRVVARLCGRDGTNVGALLDQVGLERRPEPISAYSAGMRKRLGLALLLLREPELVLLDEPFAALDPSGMADVARFVRELPGTVIIASHQLARAAELCDRAVLLDQGQLRWSGPANEVVRIWQQLHGSAA